MQTVTVDLASYQRESELIQKMRERIAELEAALRDARSAIASLDKAEISMIKL